MPLPSSSLCSSVGSFYSDKTSQLRYVLRFFSLLAFVLPWTSWTSSLVNSLAWLWGLPTEDTPSVSGAWVCSQNIVAQSLLPTRSMIAHFIWLTMFSHSFHGTTFLLTAFTFLMPFSSNLSFSTSSTCSPVRLWTIIRAH